MSNDYRTKDTEQYILNDAKDDTYGTLDVTPYVETTPGSVAARQSGSTRGSKTAASVEIVDASGNQITTFGPDTTDLNGASYITKKYYTNAGAVTDGIVWSPAAGTRWHITDIYIQVSAAATVTLEDDKAGGDDPIWKAELAANSGWSHSFKTPWVSGEDAADLIITTTAGNVYVTVVGYEI